MNELRAAIKTFPDRRTGKNLTYSIEDLGLGAFSVFFTQSPSFLSHQMAMEKTIGKSNAHTIFGMRNIPTDNHIRKQLDPVSPDFLNPVFASVLNALDTQGHLTSYRSVNHTLLIALDGTQYFKSNTINCEQCNCKKHKNGKTTYFHTVVTPVIVAPEKSNVFPLEPAFVVPQDGSDKQDCENAAAKRWLETHGERCKTLGVTLLGDDLYCHQPMCEVVKQQGLHFIFVCKPDSHKTLYEWVAELERLQGVQPVVVHRRRGLKKEIDWYRFVNGVPLRDGDDAMMVNFCELTTMTDDGVVEYHNVFVTDHEITQSNVAEIVAAGRTRWKIENENNNTLKTKGYHFTHNYGHGTQHLSSLLCAMIIVAFLFHTLLELGDNNYRHIRQALPRRDTFFNHIQALTCYLCFKNWEALMLFMMKGLELEPVDSS
ncbi:MAG: transposase [Candidatus Tectomicrobia bacterium]|uniref:Transposase n=1 Tax=Tectimicrobiota bacterium TaxID=2528274 RepID=A0A933GLY6_UNCTE|nr:transposase [Candidatus Tectomicrobia bacterium]